jgi:hypothetical protein
MVYSDNDLRNIALQYKTRKEFDRGKQTAYQCAIRRGPYIDKDGNIIKYSKYGGTPKSKGLTNTFEFLNKICEHMTPQGNLYKRVIYVYKFYDENDNKSNAYVGLTYNPDRRKHQHIEKTTQKSAVKKFIEHNPSFRYEFEILTDFLSPDVARSMEESYINQFKNAGWNMLNIAKGGVLGGGVETPLEELKRITSKYVYYTDFMYNDENAYKTAHRRGLLDEITKDLLRKDNRKYTDEDIINSALECGSYSLFYKKYKKTKWQQAYRRDLLPKIKELLQN